MHFPDYTIWIFAAILVLLAVLAIFPSYLTISLAVLLSFVLIVFQVILILKDKSSGMPK